MASCVSRAQITNVATDRYIRVLRWTFSRDSQTLLCELGLTADEAAYELRIEPPRNPTGIAVECFDEAMPAFQRHAMIERALLDEGWTLDSFESKKIER